MDSLINYQDILQQLNEQRETEMKDEEDELDEKKKNIAEFTSGFESPATDFIVESAGAGALKLAKKYGYTKKDIEDMAEGYRKEGTTGVVKQIFKKSNVPKKLSSLAEEDEGQSISSLPTNVFNQTSGLIKSALGSQYDALSDSKKEAFKDIMNDAKRPLEDFKGDKVERLKDRLNSAQKALEKLEKMPEDDEAIKSATKTYKLASEFSRVIPAAGEDLEKAGRAGLIDGMKGTTQVFRTLEQSQQQAGGLLSGLKNSVQNAVQSVSSKFQNASTQGLDDAEQAAKNSVKNIAKTSIKKDLEQSGENALKKGAEADVEEGGPENPLGDVVGGVVALGTMLGGLFAARHLHAPPVEVPNISYEIGANV